MEKGDDIQNGSTTSNGKPVDAADSKRRDTIGEHRLEESHPKAPEERGQSSPKARLPDPGTQLHGVYGMFPPPLYHPYTTTPYGPRYHYPPAPKFGYEDHGYNGIGTSATYRYNHDLPPYQYGGSVYGSYMPPCRTVFRAKRRAKQEDNPPPAAHWGGGGITVPATSSNVATALKQQKMRFQYEEPAPMVGYEESRDGDRRRRAYMRHVTDYSGWPMPTGAMNKQPHKKSTKGYASKNDSVTALVSRVKLYESESDDSE